MSIGYFGSGLRITATNAPANQSTGKPNALNIEMNLARLPR
jgi:hypothetical protein